MMRMASSCRTTWTTNSTATVRCSQLLLLALLARRQRRLGRKTYRRRPRRLPGMLHCACADSSRPSRNPIQRFVLVGLAECPPTHCIYIAYTCQGGSPRPETRFSRMSERRGGWLLPAAINEATRTIVVVVTVKFALKARNSPRTKSPLRKRFNV